MKKLFLVTFTVLLVFSCRKNDTKEVPDIPEEPKITYTVDSATTTPSSILTLTSDRKLTKDTCTVWLGGKQVLLIKMDSLHYGFMVPVLSPGKHILDLNNIDAANRPSVTIAGYPVITNPDAVITQVVVDYDKLVDSLQIKSFNNSVSTTDAAFMHQLMDQLTENLKMSTPEQKLVIAYHLQRINLSKSLAEVGSLDTGYIVYKPTDIEDDISTQMTQKAIEGAGLTVAARGAATVFAFSLVAVIHTGGNPYAIASMLVSLAAYKLLTAAAAEKNAEAAAMVGVALDNISNDDGSGSSGNPVIFTNGQSVWEKLKTRFRAIQQSDKTGLNNSISNCIDQSNGLEQEDIVLKTKFDNLKSRFSSFFGSINTSYNSYISPILATAKQRIAGIKNKYLIVTKVSNADILIVISDDGAAGLKIEASNPAQNITSETDFAFDLTYSQPAINNKVTITQQARFIPELNIGDLAHGGVVFHIDGTGRHGLVSSLSDQSTAATWFDASAICSNYRGGGYDDWFLPSISQLDSMYKARDIIGNFNGSCSNANFGQCSYWSSTEISSDVAWNVYFVGGGWWDNYGKSGLGRVRAIRAF